MIQIVTCFLAAFLFVGDKAEAEQSAKDLEKLQGTWEVVSIEAEEKNLPKEDVKGSTFVFAKDKLTMGKGDKTESATITLDASRKPKWINTKSKEGDDLQGIYHLDGDDLKICLSKKIRDRPKGFATKDDSDHGLLILKRKKK